MFQLFLATPEKKIVGDAELEEITVPGFAGELCILPGHAPLMTTLEPGIVRYKLKNGTEDKLAIGWGYCQVSASGVSVLVEDALKSDEVDLQSVEKGIAMLETKIGQDTFSDQDLDKMQKQLGTFRAQKNLIQ